MQYSGYDLDLVLVIAVETNGGEGIQDHEGQCEDQRMEDLLYAWQRESVWHL